MHARVMTALVQAGKRDEFINIYRDSIAPVAKEQKGFKGIFLLTEPETGKVISITLWETEAAMAAGEASGYLQEQVAKVARLLTAPPVREHYEVNVKA